MKRFFLSCFVLLCLVPLFPPTLSADSRKVPGLSPLLLSSDSARQAKRLEKIVAEVMAEYDVPGMAMAIKFADGSVFRHAAGVADIATGEKLTVEHAFRIGSASKTITATAVLLLYQEGRLDLDQTVDELLPDLAAFAPNRGEGITVRMLLRHLSGLADYVGGTYENRDFAEILVDQPERSWSPRELVEIGVGMDPVGKAGEVFSYSNTNYILLGLIIEKIGGMPYEQFVQEHIFDVLGLRTTLAPVTGGFPGKYAHGYLERDGDGRLYDYSIQDPSGVWAAGNIISTVGDLLVWLEALIEGKLLQPIIREEQFDFGETGYGLGVARLDGAQGHNGTVMGYQTWMFEYRGVYFVISNNCYYLQGNVGHLSQVLFERMKGALFDEEP